MDRIYKALSDPTRREIIRLLRQRDMTAGEIAGNFTLSKPTLTGHFAVLREAGLIHGEKSGTTITYSLHLSVLEDALALLMDQFRIGQPRARTTASPKVPS
ncbi:MAG: transcriptional regulator [Mesorhizobium sp. SCN 65-20]|nr:MAG: transcriptional regulator [Mesorhizobium sp. SCN 65-20]